MLIVRKGNNSHVILEPTTEKALVDCLELMNILKRKAQPYYRRGYTAVTEPDRTIRSFEDAREIVYKALWKSPKDDEGALNLWDYATVMARAYCAGVEAARAGHLLPEYNPDLAGGDSQ